MLRLINPLRALLTTFLLAGSIPATAAVIRPSTTTEYPIVDAGIHGSLDYRYDPQSGLGILRMSNMPYAISGGHLANSEFPVTPDGQSVPSQSLTLVLNQNGQLVNSPLNSYELTGSINASGQLFQGVLLKATPTAFGAQDLGVVGIQGVDLFDVNLTPISGALAGYFINDGYLQIQPEWESTFAGRFDQNFSAGTPLTYLESGPRPIFIPEPTTLSVLVTGSLLVLARRYRRARNIERAMEGAQ